MILCICLSTALDITYRLPRFELGDTNRVTAVLERPGGKAVNVARILHRLDEPVRLLAPIGGSTGEAVAAGLKASGIAADLVPSGVTTRRTIAVTEDDGSATVIVEPARLDCWPQLLERARHAIGQAEVVVVSGTVPEGVPADGMGRLVRLAREAHRPVLVDTSGAALADAVAAGPTMIKPNAIELFELARPNEITGYEPEAAAHRLATSSGSTVVASLGHDGLYAVRGEDSWRVRPLRRLTGNPTGAGDAVVAGLARGLRSGADLSSVLADCIALSAAAVLNPAAGDIDLDEYQRQALRTAEVGAG